MLPMTVNHILYLLAVLSPIPFIHAVRDGSPGWIVTALGGVLESSPTLSIQRLDV